MANSFRKRPQVDVDLGEIWNYIAGDSVDAANKQIDRIGDVFEMLVENPRAGRERIDLRPGVRSFPAGAYVVFYVALDDGIEVIRVMHGRRDIDADDLE